MSFFNCNACVRTCNKGLLPEVLPMRLKYFGALVRKVLCNVKALLKKRGRPSNEVEVYLKKEEEEMTCYKSSNEKY